MISATVAGHLGRDAEYKVTPGGTGVLNFTIASNTRKKEGDSWVDATDWVSCTLWGDRGEKLAQYLTKGSGIVVRGALTVREYQKRDGSPGYSLELRADDVQLMGKASGESQGQSQARRQSAPAAGTRRAPPAQSSPGTDKGEFPYTPAAPPADAGQGDDDIPF